MANLTSRAKKDLARLPSKIADQARELIRRLDDEPSLGKKLHGQLDGKRSVRLGRNYRIIYKLRDDGVLVNSVVSRQRAYH